MRTHHSTRRPGAFAGDCPREQPSGGDPVMARARMFEALLSLVEALGEERPLVLVIEDAHWADRSTGPVVGQLL